MKKKKKIDDGFNLELFRPIVGGVAGASAIISAACITGLPSATCAALAQTYVDAIDQFGLAGMVSLLTYICLLKTPNEPGWSRKLSFFMGAITATIAGMLFLIAIGTGPQSLKDSLRECYPAAEKNS